MGLIKEPKGIDFIVQSEPLTEEEKALISAFIQARKAALKKKKVKRLKAKKKSAPPQPSEQP